MTRVRFDLFALSTLLLVAALVPALAAADVIESTFASGFDGWTTDNTGAFSAPGYLLLDNDEQGVAHLFAPAKFLGNLSKFNGGELSFEGALLGSGGSLYNAADDYGVIQISGGGSTAKIDLLPGGATPPGSFTKYKAKLDATTWGVSKATWAAILANVTGIRVTVESLFGKEVEGFDNFRLEGEGSGIAAIEMTQSIQQYQTLADLKTSLQSTGEPPVPLIAGKPGVMRVYFDKVDKAKTVKLKVTGAITATKTIDLQPNCAAEKQRSHAGGCPSLDVYFTPPAGTWQVVLALTDSSDAALQDETLNFKSRTTNAIRIAGVSVCDSRTGPIWTCGSASALVGNTDLIRRMMPTSTVTLELTGKLVRAEVPLPPLGITISDADLEYLVRKVDELFTPADAVSDGTANRRTTYFGIYRQRLGSTGIAHDIPSHAGMAPDQVLRFGRNGSAQCYTHETGHTLNLRHTNTDVPSTTTAPGCYSFSEDDGTDWPYVDNQIQTANGLEWGFDVETKALLDPNVTYDIMSYCLPRWISPLRYNKAIATLGGGATVAPALVADEEASESISVIQPPLTSGEFWRIAGSIPASGLALDPIFTFTTEASSDAGTGTHSIEVQDGTGNALFTRFFTPATPATETTGADIVGYPVFSELVPVTPGAAKIVVKNGAGNPLGSPLPLTGTAPTVGITTPAAGFNGLGTQTIVWTITDPDSTSFTSQVLYSADNGAHWTELGEIPDDTSLGVDFAALPGTSGATALMRVLVSDGVNTGSATSVPFTVAKKSPASAIIESPAAGFAQAAIDPLILVGDAYDPDDGMLAGAQLQWSSNLQGALGTGSPLAVALQAGAHTITLTATDSDGHAVSATTNVVIGGDPPALGLATAATSAGCTNVTITATPGSTGGAALTGVQFSLDAGVSYTTIPESALPFSFVAPGTGTVTVNARAYDVSQQSAARSLEISNPPGCPAHGPVCIGGTTISKAKLSVQKIGAPLGDEKLGVKGTLDFAPGNPPTFDPATTGAQLLIEDLGSGAVEVFDLTHFTFAVPPGTVGTGCDKKKDGWKKLAYKNKSGALDPPTCTAKSAHGLTGIKFQDQRAKKSKGKSKGIPFSATVKGAAIPAFVGPARITVVLGGTPVAGEAGACGSYAFEVASCKRKKATLNCK